MTTIENLTIGEARQLASLFQNLPQAQQTPQPTTANPLTYFIGKRCIVRTYSAGVHIGEVMSMSDDGMSCVLKNALRLWKWEGGGLSLSAVANNGIKKGRLNRTGEVGLTNCIEYIPTTSAAEATFEAWIED